MVLGGSFASAFLNGEGAMCGRSPTMRKPCSSEAPLTIWPPCRPCAFPTTGAVYRNHGYAVPTTAENKEEAWKFLEWLVSGTLDGGTPLGK